MEKASSQQTEPYPAQSWPYEYPGSHFRYVASPRPASEIPLQECKSSLCLQVVPDPICLVLARQDTSGTSPKRFVLYNPARYPHLHPCKGYHLYF